MRITFAALVCLLAVGCGGTPGEAVDTEAPQITSAPVTSALVGQEYAYAITVTGKPAPDVAVTGENGAALSGWLTLDPETLVLSGTPAASDEGVHGVLVTATNGVEPNAEQSFEIAVSGPPVERPAQDVVSITGGGGTVSSSNYSMRIVVGGPSPMGSAKSEGHSVDLGPGVE